MLRVDVAEYDRTLRKSVFQKVQQLVPQFAPTCAMADFEEASVAGFQHVYPDDGVAGCWFHYAQAIIKIVHLCVIWCRVVRCPPLLYCLALSSLAKSVHTILMASRCQVLCVLSQFNSNSTQSIFITVTVRLQLQWRDFNTSTPTLVDNKSCINRV